MSVEKSTLVCEKESNELKFPVVSNEYKTVPSDVSEKNDLHVNTQEC